ncbi:hypothetical protein TNCV_4026041 [Trichonephila clavipes]|nr:hypothetical protein TNCV_4026041 [Trichonephila clavipes]
MPFSVSVKFSCVTWPNSHGRELVTGVVESWVRFLAPLKTCRVERMMNVKSVETLSPSIEMEENLKNPYDRKKVSITKFFVYESRDELDLVHQVPWQYYY